MYRAIATGYLGFAHLEKGEAHEAVVALEQSVPLLRQFGMKAFEGWFMTFLADANRLEGRLDQAGALAQTALRIATDANSIVAIGWAQLSLGRTAEAQHDLPAATEWLDTALTTFTKSHSRYECARAHMDLGRIWWARGEMETARRHLAAAHELFRELSVPRYCASVQRLAADCGILLEGERPS
jgi:tetratricopeptide (TPR) repeat protein